jgi:alpha-L-rhamnosidase
LPSASNNINLTEHEKFKGNIIVTPSGKKVIDFGQNIAGYLEFTVNAKAGEVLHLRFGELIDKDGELTLKNIQCTNSKITTPLQEVHYTARNGINHYKTKFAIFGFQYVEVVGNIEWNADDFTAIAVYSDMEETLDFNCSHPLINKFVENTRWAAKNNHAEIPTDCPTRERHGWTGDAQIFATTAGYLFDYTAFARKFVRMMGDDQSKNGKIKQIVPPGGTDFYMAPMDGCAGWADAEIIIPYKMWKLRGDVGIIKENYENMKRYADYTVWKIGKIYLTSEICGVGLKHSRDILNYGQAYGEWAEPDDVKAMHWTDFILTKPEVSTAYGSYVLSLMAEISDHMNDSASAEKYRAAAERLKIGYRALRKTKKYPLDTDRQAQLVRPLYFDLLDREDAEYAKARLIKALDNYGWRVGTGFLSTPLILYVLADIDIEYAYKLLENEEMPGWLFMPKNGATSIWEAWEGNSTENGGIASLNHYSKGAVCQWIFGEMCGIKVGEENEYIVEPKVGGTITQASCEYSGIFGKVKSEWRREDSKTIYTITVPANTSVRAILPNGEHILTAGTYTFEI